MKRCPYCGVEHDRPGLARFCSPAHAKAFARQESRYRGKTDRALRHMKASKEQEQIAAERWRDIAMGRNVDERLAEIFPPGSKKRRVE